LKKLGIKEKVEKAENKKETTKKLNPKKENKEK
jgi:hypothetical protein